ncbi:MAG TPA: ferrous iron transport protein B [Rectinema sp.]|nr:ferrous iron transport protein B [Rectinema sp.]
MQDRVILTIALAGNPNSGKTSVFNAITGAHHKVGNYPGVTVEKREGKIEFRDCEIRVVDLPGTYSLTAYSLDEVVARDFLLNEKPDIVIDVLDSTNLERNLYLLLQLIELEIPVVAALNMADEAKEKGIVINHGLLSKTLGVPMVPTVGSRGEGVEELLNVAISTYETRTKPRMPSYGEDIEVHIANLVALLKEDGAFSAVYSPRWIAIKLIEKDADAKKRISGHIREAEILAALEDTWRWIALHYRKDPEILISEQRYGYIHGAVAEAVRRTRQKGIPLTEQIDNVVMHPFISLPLFFLIIWAIFKLTFAIGEYPMAWLEGLFADLTRFIQNLPLPDGVMDFLVNAVIHGVGGVLSFVPLIVILFFCISFLEDTGYIARAAFLTDHFLHAIGLHGQSFMPLMLGFGCSVPAIMATRTLKSPKERIATILAIPFISCGGKLPIYVLLAGTFFPNHESTVVMLVYATGVVLSILSTYFLRRTVLKGQSMPFVMELPPYRMPTLKGVLWHVWEKTWSYVRKAGTIILAVSVLMWVITSYPKAKGIDDYALQVRQEIATAHPDFDESLIAANVEILLRQYQLERSIAGNIGKIIEPVIAPIGFNWKIGIALLPGLTAKELVVSTLGVLYGTTVNDETEANSSLRQALRNSPDWSPRIALALLIFILVMPPCFSSLAVIRTEAGDKWLAFQVVYSLVLAWVLSFLASMAGHLLGLG